MTDFYGRDLDPPALWYIHVCGFIIIAASLWQPVVSFSQSGGCREVARYSGLRCLVWLIIVNYLIYYSTFAKHHSYGRSFYVLILFKSGLHCFKWTWCLADFEWYNWDTSLWILFLARIVKQVEWLMVYYSCFVSFISVMCYKCKKCSYRYSWNTVSWTYFYLYYTQASRWS